MIDRRPWAFPVIVYALSRVLIFGAFELGARRSGVSLLDGMAGWDGGYYTAIARAGYPAHVPSIGGHAAESVLGFFPLYPLVIRAVSSASGLSINAAAVLVANVAGGVAVWLLWLLVRETWDEQTARRTTVLFCLLPGTSILSMAYTESLVLVLVISALFSAMRRRWFLAGGFAALASATRPDALILCLVFGVVCVAAIRNGGGLKSAASVVLAPLGALVFFAYLWAHTGEPAAWFRVEREGWKNGFDFGHASLGRASGLLHHPTNITFLVTTGGLLFVAVATILLLRSRVPTPLVVYGLAITAVAVGSRLVGARPRAIVVAFPLAVAVAVRLHGRWFALVAAGSGGLACWIAWLTLGSRALTP